MIVHTGTMSETLGECWEPPEPLPVDIYRYGGSWGLPTLSVQGPPNVGLSRSDKHQGSDLGRLALIGLAITGEG
jgi:hypothetical protein